MKKKYEHLLNLDEQRIVSIHGIPGAGKSTIAQEFVDVGYKLICPDNYRKEISKNSPGKEHWTDSMHESNQFVSKEAWEMAFKDSIQFLKEGKSIVFDALLHTQKARRRFFAQLNKMKVPYFSIYVDTTFKTALERNSRRGENGGRTVPDFIIHEKWRTQILPSLSEGFKENIVVSELNIKKDITQQDRDDFVYNLVNDTRNVVLKMFDNGTLKDWFPSLYQCWGISQDNHHHKLLLHEHMITAAELIEDRSPEMVISGLLHDVGKRNTKEYFLKVISENEHFKVGEKLVIFKTHRLGYTVEKKYSNSISQVFLPHDIVEVDENAHFYNHELVGAFDARRDLLNLGFDEEFANNVYFNIVYHMELPYREASNKHFKKLIRKVGSDRIIKLLSIRKADKQAGSLKQDFLEIHEKMSHQINSLLRGACKYD